MKKRTPRPIPPQMIPRRKKDMERLAANPEAVKRIIEMNRSAAEVLEKQKTLKTTSLLEWFERCMLILPDLYNTEEFKAKFKSFIDENKQDIETEVKAEETNDTQLQQ